MLSRKAYVKPLLHAAKYPHCAVNGLLLAERQKHRDSKILRIIDAIPLFHSSLTLAPMMEVALTMVHISECRKINVKSKKRKLRTMDQILLFVCHLLTVVYRNFDSRIPVNLS